MNLIKLITNFIIFIIFFNKIKNFEIKIKKVLKLLFEISKWSVKPILMDLEYRTKDKSDFIKNLIALIKLIEFEKEIEINRNNLFEYIHIHELENNLINNDLLDYLEIENLKELDNL